MRSSPLLLIGIVLLSSCAAGGGGRETSLTHDAAPESLTALIALRVLEQRGGMRKVGIVILNPSKIPVQSVRAWVRFDPAHTHVENLAVADGRFMLFAPGEREIDAAEGLVKIGGAVRASIRDASILLATFTVRTTALPSGERNILAFYDWQAEGDGHTAVLSLGEEHRVTNIVRAPSSLDL